MLKAWFLLIMLITVCSSNAQSVSTLMGARVSSLGNASSCLSDEWSLFNNVAGLAKISNTITAFTYDSRPTLIAADRMAFVFAHPIKVGVAALGLFKFGNDVYSEQIITTGYSNSFGIASLGIKLNYIQYSAQGFGSKGVVSVSAGGVAQLTPQLSIGAHIININQSNIASSKDEKEYIPTLLMAGLGFKATEKVFITTEIEKDLSYNTIWKSGLEYAAHKKLIIRTGFNLHPYAGYFGLGFKPKKFTLDYAFRYEPVLGGSHQASVGYNLGRK